MIDGLKQWRIHDFYVSAAGYAQMSRCLGDRCCNSCGDDRIV